MGDERREGRGAPETSCRQRPGRERIFRTACDLFYRRGIRATGVEAIAAEAGATKMTLYRNFPSKDELALAYLGEQAGAAEAWWNATVAPFSGDPRAQLEAVFRGYAALASTPGFCGCAVSNAAMELHDPSHPVRQAALAHKGEIRRRLGDLAQAAGAQDERLADALMLLIEGGYVSALTLGAGGPLRAFEDAARRLISAYLDA